LRRPCRLSLHKTNRCSAEDVSIIKYTTMSPKEPTSFLQFASLTGASRDQSHLVRHSADGQRGLGFHSLGNKAQIPCWYAGARAALWRS
jgi:hypothetical protein